MIRRNTSNASNFVERISEYAFSAANGINTQNSYVSNNTVSDMLNFDVKNDGSVSLRNPLINLAKFEKAEDNNIVMNYSFDKDYRICIIINDNSCEIYLIYEYKNPDTKDISLLSKPYYLKYTTYTGTVKKVLVSETATDTTISHTFNIKAENPNIVNTTTTTILTGLSINRTFLENLVDPVLYDTTKELWLPRYLKFYFDESNNPILEVIPPEMNVLSSAESAVFNPNLTLDYPYAIRDNYDASSVGVSNILAYSFATIKDNYSKPEFSDDYDDTSFNNWSVKKLTEQVYAKNIVPRILYSIPKNFNKPICLKAFVDVKSNDNSLYICLWEKTFDGVHYEEVPEFLSDNNYLIVDIPDVTNPQETLGSSDNAKVAKKCKIFNPKNTNDLVKHRPDCLVLNTIDNATYRFSIYSLKNSTLDVGYKDMKLFVNSLDNQIDKFENTDYYRIDKTVENIYTSNEEIIFLQFPLYTTSTFIKNKFTIRAILKDSSLANIDDLTITFNKTTNLLTLRFKLTLPSVSNFYSSNPILFKIYYDDKIFYILKTIFNHYLTFTYNSLTKLNNAKKLYIFEDYDKQVTTSTSDTYYNTNPYNVDIIEEFFKLKDYVLNIPYVFDAFVVYYTNPESIILDGIDIYTKYNLKNLDYTVHNVNFYNIPTNNDIINSKYIYTTTVSDFKCVPIVIKTNIDEYAICDLNSTGMVTDQTLAIDMDMYYNIKNSSKYILNLPEIYDTVNIIDKQPFEEYYMETKLTAGIQSYSFIFNTEIEFLYTDSTNTVLGNKLYYKKVLYTYGKNFKNNVYPTYVDSFITPLFNVIDLDSTDSNYVTTLTPWRDYLVAATESNIHLIIKQSEGYLTKIVNNFIGIPYKDRKTCKAILNGIIFKSGTKVYSLQPNSYSDNDSILSIVDISKPINGLIVDTIYENFSFSTESAYYLFIPNESETTCFKYEYSKKVWTHHLYPRRFDEYHIFSVDNIRIFSNGTEFYFDKKLCEIYSHENCNNIRYGDYLTISEEKLDNYILDSSFITPIKYYIKSGQKTDLISITKQFVESKFIVATLDNKDIFNFSLDILINGTYFPIHIDVNTDSEMWKNSIDMLGTLNTNFVTNTTDRFNTLRQMFIRYSGKGKSIEHIISGVSYFNFKFYMLYYRYRNLNVKQ